MNASRRPSPLDLMHKGVYPALAIAVALSGVAFAVYTHATNTDSQRKIATLQREVQELKDLRVADRAGYAETVRRVEDHVQAMRVELCKGLYPGARADEDGPDRQQAIRHTRVWVALLAAGLQLRDGNVLGHERSAELWDAAQKEAERRVRGNRLDWSV